jgi:hypothetical protein
MARTATKRPTIAIERLTPDAAADLLDANTINRNIRQRRVDQYARDMQAGHWQPVGEPIAISDAGRLLNGQHRLIAIMQAGVAIELPVLRGVAAEAQDVIDRGLTRSFSDVLRLHYDQPSAVVMAAAVRQLHQYRTDATMGRTGGSAIETSPTAPELAATYNAERGLANSVPTMQHCRRDGGIWLSPGLLIAMHYVFGEIADSDGDLFFERLTYGDSLERGNPVLALRQMALRRPIGISPRMQAALSFKAFNYWRAQRHVELGALQWRNRGPQPEAFPRLLTEKQIKAGVDPDSEGTTTT